MVVLERLEMLYSHSMQDHSGSGTQELSETHTDLPHPIGFEIVGQVQRMTYGCWHTTFDPVLNYP